MNVDLIFKIAAVGILVAVFNQLLSAPLSWCLALAGGLAILWLGAGVLREALAEAGNLLAASGLDSGIYLPVVRVVAIGVLVRLTGALCKDAGQNALADKLELAYSRSSAGTSYKYLPSRGNAFLCAAIVSAAHIKKGC